MKLNSEAESVKIFYDESVKSLLTAINVIDIVYRHHRLQVKNLIIEGLIMILMAISFQYIFVNKKKLVRSFFLTSKS